MTLLSSARRCVRSDGISWSKAAIGFAAKAAKCTLRSFAPDVDKLGNLGLAKETMCYPAAERSTRNSRLLVVSHALRRQRAG